MKKLLIELSDEEYAALAKVKNKLGKTWKDMLLMWLQVDERKLMVRRVNEAFEALKADLGRYDPDLFTILEAIRVALIMYVQGGLDKASFVKKVGELLG